MARKDTTKMEQEIEMEAQCLSRLMKTTEIQTIYSLIKAVFPLVSGVSSYSILVHPAQAYFSQSQIFISACAIERIDVDSLR